MASIDRTKKETFGEDGKSRGMAMSQAEFASVYGVSPSSLKVSLEDASHLIDRRFHKGKTVVFSGECIRYLIEKAVLKERARHTDVSGATRPEEELKWIKARRQKVNAEKLKIEEKYVLVDDARELFGQMATVFIAGIEALPGRLAQELAPEMNAAAAREILFREVRYVRQALEKQHAKSASMH